MWPLARAAESHRSLGRPTPSKQLIIGTNTIDRVSICLSVVPVYVGVGSWSVATFALLDPGSQGTLLTDEMSCRLNLTRKPSNVHVSTFHGHDPSLRVCSLDFVIRGRSGKQQFNIKGALVVPSLNLSCRTVDWSREKNKWPHLKDLPLDAINYENVSVLIGADNIELIQRLALRKPLRKGEPFGVLTPLGWTVIELHEQHCDLVSGLICSGIVRAVSSYDANLPFGRAWYLPHHPVRHDSKPDKARVVFDASAKFEGRSLNDCLSKGPDLLCHMTSLLVRFRLLPLAVTSDIASMFHQVGVPVEDRSILRFLWSDSADTAEGEESQYFALWENFLKEKHIRLTNVMTVTTDGAPSTVESHRGLIAHLKEVIPTVSAVHCVIHRQHLLAKHVTAVFHCSSEQNQE
ncbi:hypothetical protein M513_08403 [Trichuris suis]|uniref:Peptidase aspartic putative domain-containing protein n=1 Tax=Trichuris suis TaxID=68888 RepID=A0A085M0K1_9BILA|nr:hypothetical protein M513_08403 [Trichuris suis]